MEIQLTGLAMDYYVLELYLDDNLVWSIDLYVGLKLTPNSFTAGEPPYTFNFSFDDSSYDPNNIYIKYFYVGDNFYGRSFSKGTVKAEKTSPGSYEVTIPGNLLVGPYEIEVLGSDGDIWGPFTVEPPEGVYANFYKKEYTILPEGYDNQSELDYTGAAYNASGYDFTLNLESEVEGINDYCGIAVNKVESNNPDEPELSYTLSYTLPTDIPVGRYRAVITASNGTNTTEFEIGKVIVGYPHIISNASFLPAYTSKFELKLECDNIDSSNNVQVKIVDSGNNTVASSKKTVVELGHLDRVDAEMVTSAVDGLDPGNYKIVVVCSGRESEPYPIEVTDEPLLKRKSVQWEFRSGITNFGYEVKGYNISSDDIISAKIYDEEGSEVLAQSTSFTISEVDGLQRIVFDITAEDQAGGMPQGYLPVRIFINNSEAKYLINYNSEPLAPLEEIVFLNNTHIYKTEPEKFITQTPTTMKIFGTNLVQSDVVFFGETYDKNDDYQLRFDNLTPIVDERELEYFEVNLPPMPPGKYRILVETGDSNYSIYCVAEEAVLTPAVVKRDELPKDISFTLPDDIDLTDSAYVKIVEVKEFAPYDRIEVYGPITAQYEDEDGSYSFNLPDIDNLEVKEYCLDIFDGQPGEGNDPVVSGILKILPEPPIISSPGNGDVLNTGITISGTGEPGMYINIYIDNSPDSISTEVDGDGNWSVVRTFEEGSHEIKAILTDQFGTAVSNYSETVSFTVDSTVDTEPPVIQLNGDASMTVEAGEPFVDPGATATDNKDGDISARIVVDPQSIDTSVTGTYTITYNVSDSAGNAAVEVTRTVEVVDTTPPVITPLGANPLTITVGSTYSEPGATAYDEVDGDLTSSIVIDDSNVDTSTLGNYTVTYTVSDESGNETTATRTVYVVDTDVIIPKFVFDRNAYGPGSTLQLQLKLTNIPEGAKTNSAEFKIQYDSTVFELATGVVDTDVVTESIPFNTKNDSGGLITVSYTDMKNDIPLSENGTVVTINFKVKENAEEGSYSFTYFEPTPLIDSSDNVYNVNNNVSLSQLVTVSNCATVEGYLKVYMGDEGGLNDYLMGSFDQETVNTAFRNLLFTLRNSTTGESITLTGTEVFIANQNGNLAYRDGNNNLVGYFQIDATNFDMDTLEIKGGGYLKKTLDISLSPGAVTYIGESSNPVVIYPGDIGRVLNGLEHIPDDVLNTIDFSVWLKIYRESLEQVALPEDEFRADFTKDGKLNTIDFSLWLASYRKLL